MTVHTAGFARVFSAVKILSRNLAVAYLCLVRKIRMRLFAHNTIIVLTFLLSAGGHSQPAPDPILGKICTGTCSGGMASVTPWLNSTGKTGYYEFSGDLRTCSHPPLVLYDSKGREALTIPNQPLDADNKEMTEKFKKLHQKREELLKGHTPSRAIFCSEGPR